MVEDTGLANVHSPTHGPQHQEYSPCTSAATWWWKPVWGCHGKCDMSRLAQKHTAVWALYGVCKHTLGQKNELWFILLQEHSYTRVYFEVWPKKSAKAHSLFVSLFYKGLLHDAGTMQVTTAHMYTNALRTLRLASSSQQPVEHNIAGNAVPSKQSNNSVHSIDTALTCNMPHSNTPWHHHTYPPRCDLATRHDYWLGAHNQVHPSRPGPLCVVQPHRKDGVLQQQHNRLPPSAPA